MTMFDARLRLSNQVADEVRRYFGDKVFGTIVQRNVRLSEAPSFGKPVLLYDATSVGARNYIALAKEILRNNQRYLGDRHEEAGEAAHRRNGHNETYSESPSAPANGFAL